MSPPARSRRARPPLRERFERAPRAPLLLAYVAACVAACGPGPSLDAGDDGALDGAPLDDAQAADVAEPDALDAAADGSARADGSDASRADGDDGSDGAPRDDVVGTVRYTADRTQSPLTEALAGGLRARVLAGAPRDEAVFAKVGASNTVNRNFMVCFAGANVDLAGREELRPTLEHFRRGDAAGTTPYERESLAATVGWSASAALAGDPPPIDREIAAIDPRYALIMFGTNDIQSNDPYRYAEHMFALTDRVLAAGVLPIISSVPPRDDSAVADANVPRFNAVARGVAQARGVPFIDLERELRPISGHALVGDGIHLDVYTQGGAARGCVLTPAGLRHGQNLRNLLSLTALSRARAVLAGAPAPDDEGTVAHLAGAGTAATPFEIDGDTLPFVDARDTRRDGAAALDRYAGCMASQDESGREVLYRLTLRTPRRLRAFVASRTGVDVDLHVLSSEPTGAGCVERNDRVIVRDFSPGTHYFSLDTYAPPGGTPRAGEYLFVLLAE